MDNVIHSKSVLYPLYEHVSSYSKDSPETISKVSANLENIFVGSIAGVKTTESGEDGGKNKNK